MTPASLTANMVAVSRKAKIKPLGFITWFTVPDRPVNIKHLKAKWLLAGLDPAPLPDDPRSMYLFKRAMREQEGKVRLADGTVVETDVKDVVEDSDLCIYQISRVVRDKDNRVVDYPKAMRVTYVKDSEDLLFDALKGVPKKDLLPMEEAISDYFDNNAKMIDGRKVRTLVRNFLKDDSDEQSGIVGLSGENMRGKAGGVYFIPVRFAEEIEGLSQCLEELYPDGAAELCAIPLMDGSDARELIRRQHVANAKKEIDEAIADVAKLLRDDRKNAVRSDVKEHHWRRLQALRRRSGEYNTLLKEEQEDVEVAGEMLEKQLKKLA